MKLTFLILSFFTFSSVNVDWKSDLKKVRDKYNEKISYSSNLEYKMYADGVLTESQTSFISYSKGSYYLKMEGVEVFANPNYNLTVSHIEKAIYVSDFVKNSTTSALIDSSIANISKTETRTISDNNVVHKLFYKEGDKHWMEIEFNKKNYEIKRIKQHYRQKRENEKGILESITFEVVYSNFRMNAPQKGVDYKGSKFIVANKKTFSPIGMYKDYQLYDFRTKK